MNTQILCTTAALSFGLGVLAQGGFALDDVPIPSGLVVGVPGNWYSGTFGMEVWELNSMTVPAGINLGGAQGSGVLGYEAMAAAGFVKESTYANQITSSPGAFELGVADMPDVSPAGATVVVALAAWNTSAPSWSAMLAGANEATRAGIVAFVQPTILYPQPGNPAEPPGLAMSQDLVLSAIPEPSVPAVAGLGAVLLAMRRRR